MANPRTRRTLVVLAAPALLAAAAALQLVRAHTLDQSSWSGGGFGMFATYENEDSRFLKVWVGRGDGERRVAVPDGLGREAFEAKVVPTGARLRSLAAAIASAAGLGDGATVRVEVWGVRFDHPSARIETFRLAAGEHRGGGGR